MGNRYGAFGAWYYTALILSLFTLYPLHSQLARLSSYPPSPLLGQPGTPDSPADYRIPFYYRSPQMQPDHRSNFSSQRGGLQWVNKHPAKVKLWQNVSTRGRGLYNGVVKNDTVS